MKKLHLINKKGSQLRMGVVDEQNESGGLLSGEEELAFDHLRSHQSWSSKMRVAHITALYIATLASIGFNLILWRYGQHVCQDPSIGLWSPAQDEVQYKVVEFDKYFDPQSPYTQKPTAELDTMWEDLYNFGISGISEEEASKLYEPTVHLPHDNRTYVVSLGVFHQLHCVNHLRRALFPDEYPGLWEYNADGTVNHDTVLALHWNHCIDILRQTLMCHADITPMPYYYRDWDDNIYSVLASSQNCRDYESIRTWAAEHQIHHWRWNETDPQHLTNETSL